MIELVPAIDIIGGKCVRLTCGDYGEVKQYSDSPVDMAKRFVDAGCSRLHLVDLDGAKANHIVNHRVLDAIASATPLKIDFGGGIKSDEDLRIAFDSGAVMVTGGSVAVKNSQLFESWLNQYGSDVIILGADTKNRKIATSGWVKESDIDVVEFIKRYSAKGVRKVISTDISVDGTLSGPSLELYSEITEAISGIYLIASGGVSSMSDVEALGNMGLPEVIVGKAIYENRISFKDIEKFNLINQRQ